MKINKNVIINSTENLLNSTTNKFWGIISIFSSIKNSDDKISANRTFAVSSNLLSTRLDDLFYFDKSSKMVNDHIIYFRLSKYWETNFEEIIIKTKPNILDVAVFFFKTYDFDKITSVDLVNKFINTINLETKSLEKLFNLNFDSLEISLENEYPKSDILSLIKQKKNVKSEYLTFSFESPYAIASQPSEFKRAPFIQTLYSGTKIQELILISDINLDDYYFSQDSQIAQASSQDVNNVIYYGSPGTGKSHRADIETNGKEVQKVTFHPDYDYHSFVGGYKPTMDRDKIAYKFVPQIFTKIYVDAWKNLVSADDRKPFYLQIEEINRGNCAEIFGDLFQLLDRDKDGFSKYEVTAEEELCKYLLSEKGFGGNHPGIENGKLRFPNNLKIIATMNTSDQSLFPMDSAFKRRWDWIYVPIDYNCSSSDFTIKLNSKKEYSWLEFLEKINEEIFEITKSQDKQIGNWFIDAQNSGKVISESTFVNKVVFYLWNDVFKDEENTIFKSADGKNLTYTSFFENGTSNNLVSYILEERLKLIDVNKAEPTTTGEE